MSLDDIIKDINSRKTVSMETTNRKRRLFAGKGKARAFFAMLSIMANTVPIDKAPNTAADNWLIANTLN